MSRNNIYLAYQLDILDKITTSIAQERSLGGENGIFTKLLKYAIKASLKGEMNAYLTENKLENPANRKNGTSSKTVNYKAWVARNQRNG